MFDRDSAIFARDELAETIELAPRAKAMDRTEAIDREAGHPFAWSFLMTHGNKVESEVGDAITKRLREARVRLPDQDAKVLLQWADERYGFNLLTAHLDVVGRERGRQRVSLFILASEGLNLHPAPV